MSFGRVLAHFAVLIVFLSFAFLSYRDAVKGVEEHEDDYVMYVIFPTVICVLSTVGVAMTLLSMLGLVK